MPIIREIVSGKDGTIVSIFQQNSNAFPVYFPTAKAKTKQKRKGSRGLCWNMFGNEKQFVKPRREDRHAWMRTAASDNHVVSRVALKRGVDDGIFGRNVMDSTIGKTDSVSRDSKEKKKNKHRSVWRILTFYLEEYCEKATLHGLKYIGDKTITFGERIFWLFSFLTAISFAAYFINNIYEKFNRNPVIISFSPEVADISGIPFPSVTICSVNVARKDEAEKIKLNGTITEKMLLDDYCDINNQTTSEDYEQTANWENVKAFILKVTQSCDEMLKVCRWKLKEYHCDKIFNPILTDDGYCCTFNRLPPEFIFRNPKELNDLNETYPNKPYDWTPEKGYTDDVSFSLIPWRSVGSGAHLGLTLVLDAQLDSYFCSTTNSPGWKMLLTSPIETPRVANYGFFVGVGTESRIVIDPQKIDSTLTLKNIDVKKRQCYFDSERYLQFYRTYTDRNCNLECLANKTLQTCNCVPYYLPKNRTTRICGMQQDECTNRVKDSMENNPDSAGCNCLPGCFEIKYKKTSSMARLSGDTTPQDKILKNHSVPYFVKNMAIVHLYYHDTTFMNRIKSEIYGFSEFLSNTGGLLGLFLGFSFLSAVEVGYYIIIKSLSKLVRNEKKKWKNAKKMEASRSGTIYPFMQ